MNDNILIEYATVNAKIKELTEKKDALRDEILGDLVESGEKTVDTAVGKFTVASVKSWTYTDKVTGLEEAFKAQKALEQSTGDATFEEKPSLRFSELKL